MTLPASEFVRRFLKHVLPCGKHRLRHYGFMSRRSQTDLDVARATSVKSLANVEPDLELDGWSVSVHVRLMMQARAVR